MRTTILSITLLTVCAVGFGATIRVPANYPTIELGIHAANNGDIVLVAPGTYKENIRIWKLLQRNAAESAAGEGAGTAAASPAKAAVS